MLTVSLEATPLTIAEGGGTSTITARLSATNTQAVTVNLSTGGTATQNTDYTLTGTQIVIPAGSLSQSITLTGLTDTVSDPDETAILSISSVTNETENGDQSVTVRLTESAGTASLRGFVRMDIDGDKVLETTDTGMPGMLVTLTGTVGSQSINLTAMTGNDGRFGFVDLPAGTYSLQVLSSSGVVFGTHQLGSSGGTLNGQTVSGIELSSGESATNYQFGVQTFAAGFVSLRYFSTNVGSVTSAYRETLAVAAERENQSSEAAQIRAGETTSNPPVVSQTGTNLPDITLRASSSTLREAGGTSTITATLSSAATQAVTINLGFTGTATETTDYTRSLTAITIAAGQTTGSITLTGVNDTLDEADETIVVSATSAVGARIGPSSTTTVTLLDDDTAAQPQVTLTTNTSSVAEAGSPVTVTANLSRAATTQVTVNLDYSGTALRGTDYQTSGLQIVIPVGQTSGSVTLTPSTDDVDELSETIIVGIGTVTGAEEQGTQQVTITLQDSNNSPIVTLSSSTDQISEAAGQATITATLSQVSGQVVTVPLTFGGTAELTADYTRSGTVITIQPGQTTGSVTVTAVEDTVDETNETITVALGAVTGASPGTSTPLSISVVDNDQPRVELTAEKTTMAENGDQIVVRAVLVAPLTEAVTVNLSFAGTATHHSDFDYTSSTITIPANQLSGQITITSLQDTLDEANETIIVDISSVTGASEGPNSTLTLTIGDDDPEPTVTLSAADTELVEGETGKTLTATLSAVSGRDVVVSLVTSGTATDETDYTLSADQITIPAGQTSGSITITPVNDTRDEFDESLLVDISTVQNGVESGTQRVEFNLNDNDPPPNFVLSANPLQINEAAGVTTITGTLAAATDKEVIVTLNFAGTATETTDYTKSGTQLIFAVGETTKTVTVTAVQDQVDDDAETVVVTVSQLQNAVNTTADPVTITIVDDDPAAQQSLAAAVDQVFSEA